VAGDRWRRHVFDFCVRKEKWLKEIQGTLSHAPLLIVLRIQIEFGVRCRGMVVVLTNIHEVLTLCQEIPLLAPFYRAEKWGTEDHVICQCSSAEKWRYWD
jgi:hypothetical protein